MNTTLLVQISGNTWEQVDLFEDIPITLTIQQNDLTNLTARRVPYSKTILIPDTPNNANIFEHYYEMNAQEFNPLQKIPVVVQYRGTDIFDGIMRMNSVITSGLERVYELNIFGEVADFTTTFRNLSLQDLDYTDLLHDLNYDNLLLSWECENDGVSGLFDGKIVYPLINYGLIYSGTTTASTPSFEYSFGQPKSFDQPQFPVSPTNFKPAIQIKTILDRMFATTEYEVFSDFFDSPYFTSIYIDTFQNAETGVLLTSAVTNQNIFKVGDNFQTFKYKLNRVHPFTLLKSTPTMYDPLNNYTDVFTPSNPNTAGTGFFRVPYAGLYQFNIRFNLQTINPALISFLFPGKIAIQVFKNNTSVNIGGGTLVYQSPDILLSQGFLGDLPVNLFFNTALAAGDFLQVFVKDVSFVGSLLAIVTNDDYVFKPFSEGGVTDEFFFWELFDSPVLATPEIDMRLGVPNLNSLQFFKGIISMFNLIVYQDQGSQKIRIEPYNTYYNDQDRKVRDFTNILDTNNDVKIEPLSFDLSKDLLWTYLDTDEEYLPQQFSGRFDFVFGRERITSTSNIFVGEQVFEIPFGPCPTSGVTGAPNFIIPQYYRQVGGQQESYATKPHIFFWCGNRFAFTDALKSEQGEWYLLSGSTAVAQNTYPCVSHLSTLESQLALIISDLNFKSTFDFFGNDTNQIQQFTQFNLYNTFWRTYVENLYNPFNKRLTGQFFFRPLDVYQTQLNDKIWIKDAFFSIEKITDADLVNKRNTQISLLKDSTPYYRIDPPAPIYAITPNQPYPFPQPFYSVVCFVSSNQTLVCNGTTPTLTAVFTFGPPTLNNLDRVFIDTGTSFDLIPMGTYLRAQTETTVYVVADIYGRILEIPC